MTLTRQRLATAVERSGQIVTVWGTSGGLGRTTMAAHLAKGLSEIRGSKPVLIADFDFGAPDLDAFFAPQGLPHCSGLAGLYMAFLRRAPRKRPLFVVQALSDERYVVKPKDFPNLVYLPSGLSPNHPALPPLVRAEALSDATA